MSFNFIDLFAGAGGLSEGFIRAGFTPIAHVEMNNAACYTLKTRMAYHHLKSIGNIQKYKDYIDRLITRDDLYKEVPVHILDSVINAEIKQDTVEHIFQKIDNLLYGKVDFIIGGPPCQAYSLIGRACDKSKMQGDQRNYLYKYYCLFLERYTPEYFIFENVTGLLSAKDINGNKYIQLMEKAFLSSGYEIEIMKLAANEFGVLQSRNRIIILGRKKGTKQLNLNVPKCEQHVKLSEIFDDLPKLQSGEGSISPIKLNKYNGDYLYESGIRGDIPVTWHIARNNTTQDKEIYRLVVTAWNERKERLNYNTLPDYLKTHRNRSSFIDRFKVVATDLSSAQTIVSHIAKDGHYYIHPDIEQNRSITPREAARIQSFPDDYYFEGENAPSRTAAFNQIGNAVPVLLAEKIAHALKKHLNQFYFPK